MNLGMKIAITVGILGEIITWAILIRALVSWLPISQGNFILRILDAVTEPVISPVRAIMNKIIKRPVMIDFSPVVAMILVELIVGVLQRVCLNLFI